MCVHLVRSQRIRSFLQWYALYKSTFYLLTYLLGLPDCTIATKSLYIISRARARSPVLFRRYEKKALKTLTETADVSGYLVSMRHHYDSASFRFLRTQTGVMQAHQLHLMMEKMKNILTVLACRCIRTEATSAWQWATVAYRELSRCSLSLPFREVRLRAKSDCTIESIS